MKMEGWLLYALLAMFSFGLYNVILKIGVDPKRGGLNPVTAMLVASVAILVSTLAYGFYTKGISIPSSKSVFIIAVFAGGIIWTIGTVASMMGLQAGNASQVVPIYNANTVVAVVLAMIFLGEATSLQYVAKVAVGAAFIMAGAYILS